MMQSRQTTYSDATPTITMSYDRVGNMTEATTANVVTNLYAYNIYGAVEGQTLVVWLLW